MTNTNEIVDRFIESLEQDSVVLDPDTLGRCIDLAVNLGEAGFAADPASQPLLPAAIAPLRALSVLADVPNQVRLAVEQSRGSKDAVRVPVMRLRFDEYVGERQRQKVSDDSLSEHELRLAGPLVFKRLSKYSPAVEFVYDSNTRWFNLYIVIYVRVSGP